MIQSKTGGIMQAVISLLPEPYNAQVERIWNQLFPLTLEPSPLYSIETWHPHITLAMEDLGWEMLDEVTAMLQKTKMKWRFKLDNFAIACQHADGKAQVEHIFRFGKGLTESFDCGLPPL